MSAYNVDYTVDLVDAFGQLESVQDKKDFLVEAIDTLDNYNDNLDVVADVATNLTETQKEYLIKEMFDYIRCHRVNLIAELINSMPAEEQQAIRDYLMEK